ncbi:MAG: hypothetical protein OYL41_02345 [Acidobacteriota bacterium]|nr:hypothetical protein [Acidobacteriota bacterium]
MRRTLPVTALFALVAATAASGAGQPGPGPPSSAVAEVVAEPVEVGDVFELEVVVEHPEGAEAAPVLEESLGDFRVLGAVPLEADGAPAGESRFRLRLGAFVLPGDHEIPPVPVGVRAANGELALIETPPAPVRVVSSLPPESEAAEGDIHDIRGPFELNVPPRWGAIGLLALGVLVLLAAAWWFWRRRGAREAPAVPLPPPAAEAEAALARLAREGLLERGDVVGYYERLAGIMKRYAGRRFETAWSERTTGEILRDLRLRAAPEHREALTLLASILGEADLAKFSERAFRPDAAQSRFREAGMFLDRTRPPLTAEPDSGDAREEELALPSGAAVPPAVMSGGTSREGRAR